MDRPLSFGSRTLAVAAALFLFAPALIFAQEARSYYYEKIAVDIAVNRDASISVEESLTYNFSGFYHQGYRSISQEGVSAITDISVIDGETLEPLQYSFRRLDKTDPSSWGRYTTYTENGATVIEWYYDLDSAAERRTWLIRYIAHGAIAFYETHDELYWNVFTDYEVPVATIEAIVRLPEPVTRPQSSFYREQDIGYVADRPDDKTFRFLSSDAAPREDVTIAVGWQKGIIDTNAFWRDWFLINWTYVASIIVLLGSLIYGLAYWYFAEKHRKGRGTIVPEYAPPRNLRPAMAKLITTERLGKSVWPATIVDLAVRGYIKIVKEKRHRTTGIPFIDQFFAQEGYFLERLQDWENDPNVEDYEKQFLNTLFEYDRDKFSTIDFKKKMRSHSAAERFQGRMRKLVKAFYAETTGDTKVYEIPLTARNWMHSVMFSRGFSVWLRFVFIALIMLLSVGISGSFVLGASILISIVGLYFGTVKNPRLNREGHLLRDDWRGFKLYLETAEKYRMQNLTPELFEKYLPYAMIFGIEKKWAKAFDSMNLQEPKWYGTTVYTGSSNFAFGSGGSAFSPSVFSASFASSFTSSFSSSGAGGGASGGGGGAGGGAGGGGGGAS